MKSDIEIAQEAKMKPIAEVAASLGLADEDVIPYGRYKAKINHRLIHKATKQGKMILVTAISPTSASVTMTVRADMLNGHATCHGGFITALADSAFAFACNAGNEMTVASGLSIDFLAPGREGDVLTAEGVEVSRAGRTGVYDVTVRNQRGELIAVFRGRSYTMKGRQTVALPQH